MSSMDTIPPTYNIITNCLEEKNTSSKQANQTAIILVSPQQVCKRLKFENLSYKNLQNESDSVAKMLSHKHIQKDDFVLIRLKTSREFPASFFGTLKIGAIPIPVSPDLTQFELEWILKDANVKAVISEDDQILQDLSSEIKHSQILFFSFNIQKQKNTIHTLSLTSNEKNFSYPYVHKSASEPAFCLYTSGTLGKPKGVLHAHRSIAAHQQRIIEWLNYKTGDIIFNTSAINWSYSLTCAFLDILSFGGTSIFFTERPNENQICQAIQQFNITTLMSVPGIYRKLVRHLQDNPKKLDSLKVCVSAGEKLSTIIRDDFLSLTNLKIYEGLGMSENSVYLYQKYGSPIQVKSCGKPVSKDIQILDKDLNPTKPFQEGILATKRNYPGLFLKYIHEDPERTFKNGWFLSGDLAYKDKEGFYYFLGRNDDIINSSGFKISPLEIENTVNEMNFVEESVAIGYQVDTKTLIRLFIKATQQEFETTYYKGKIQDHLKSHLAPYKIPHEIIFINEIPKSKNGKILREKLKAKT